MHLAISGVLAAGLLLAGVASAQSNPMAAVLDKPEPSQAPDALTYRADAARHIYQHFRLLVHRGPLPAAVQDIAILETTLDEQGAVEKVEVIRDTWLITEEGRFQLDAISEGRQLQSASAKP